MQHHSDQCTDDNRIPDQRADEALEGKIAAVMEIASSCDRDELDPTTKRQIQELISLIALASREKDLRLDQNPRGASIECVTTKGRQSGSNHLVVREAAGYGRGEDGEGNISFLMDLPPNPSGG